MEPTPPSESLQVIEPAVFLNQVRQKVFTENPQLRDNFGESVYGLSFDLMERYFNLRDEIDTKFKFLKGVDRAVLSNVRGLYTPSDRSLGMEIDGQFGITLFEDGKLQVGSVPNLEESPLMKSGEQVVGNISIDPATQTTNPPLDSILESRLKTALAFVKEYYRDFREKIPLAEQFSKNMGMTPTGIFPKFPKDEIKQLRGVGAT